MDSTQHPLSIESFSYTWLVNLRPSLESHETSFRTSLDESSNSFIEMDPRMPPSKRFLTSQETQFAFPQSEPSPSSIAHADELFFNGYVMPLFVEASGSTTGVLGAPGCCSSLRRCRTVSRRMFGKYLDFLRPLCRRIRGSGRRSSKGEDGDRARFVKTKKSAPESSPRISVAYSGDDHWRRSCDSESSIYEAVLHCKKSIGMPSTSLKEMAGGR